MKIFSFIIFLSFGTFLSVHAQSIVGKTSLNGQLVTLMLDDNGDTLFVADDLMTVSLTSPRRFKSSEEYLRYRRYLRYAAIVYPYAREAIKVFRELEAETSDLKNRKRRKEARRLQKDLDDQFTGDDPRKHDRAGTGHAASLAYKDLSRRADRRLLEYPLQILGL